MPNLLTIFGATGHQGGALIHHILHHPSLSKLYNLRGITRDITKPSARVLQGKGVEMVQADMDDPASLTSAVAGSYAVFAVTNCMYAFTIDDPAHKAMLRHSFAVWEKASASIEIAQGKAMADAAVAAGASLLIWSSLPNVTKMTEGKLSGVKHFDSKAEVESYIRDLPIKSVFYMPAFYMQNMTSLFKPKPNPDGTLIFTVPWKEDTLLPLIDITDTGKFLEPVLLNPDKYNGKIFTAATAFYKPQQMVDAWTKVTSKKVIFVRRTGGAPEGALSPEMLKSLKESTGLISDYSYYGPTGKKDMEWTLAQLTEEPTSWETFVEANEPWFEEV